MNPLGIGMLIGFVLGGLFVTTWFWLWWRTRLKQMNQRELDIAYYHEHYWQRQQLDDTRLGINTGIEFAVGEIENTLDGLKQQVKDKS